MSAAVALAVVGGGALVATQAAGGTPASGGSPPPNVAPNGGVLISAGAASSGASIGTIIAYPKSPVGTVKVPWARKLAMVNAGSSATGTVGASPQSGWGAIVSPTNGLDSALQQKLDEINRYAEAAFDKLDKDTRDVARGELNRDLKLDPPLPADASWNDISKTVGASIGGAVGGALLGPAGTVLGAMIGAYLGGKIEELISKSIPEIKDWFKSRWADIESWVKGVGSDIEDGVQDAIDYIGGIF